MQLKKEITVGNLLTVIPIILAILSFLYSQQQDREQRYQLNLEERRSASASALFVIDSLDESVKIFLLKIEPLCVEVSTGLAQHRDAEKARDELWRRLTVARAEMETAIKEDVLRSSERLAIADPTLLQKTRVVIDDHASLREKMFKRLIEGAQSEFLVHLDTGLPDTYRSAQLGNALRDAHYQVATYYGLREAEVSGPTRIALTKSLDR